MRNLEDVLPDVVPETPPDVPEAAQERSAPGGQINPQTLPDPAGP